MSFEYRLNRLFHPESGRCLDVAVDHGFFGENGFLAGIEDLGRAVDTLVDAAPDAIQLTVGQAPLLQRRPGRAKPALVLRTDIANIYGDALPEHLFSRMISEPVEQAVRLDAACVVVNLFDLHGRADVHEACIDNILSIKPQTHAASMPLMIEPLVMGTTDRGGYSSDSTAERIIPLVRQAVELGADIIKCDPTTDAADIARVVEVAGDVPVLIRGGGRVPDRKLLERTATVIEAGARGIVYGRNIVQHDNPAGMTRALMAQLHAHATVDEAAAILAGER